MYYVLQVVLLKVFHLLLVHGTNFQFSKAISFSKFLTRIQNFPSLYIVSFDAHNLPPFGMVPALESYSYSVVSFPQDQKCLIN